QTGRLSHNSACTRRWRMPPSFSVFAKRSGSRSRSSIVAVTTDAGARSSFTWTSSAAADCARKATLRSATSALIDSLRADGMHESEGAIEAQQHVKRAGDRVGSIAKVDPEVADADAPANPFQP